MRNVLVVIHQVMGHLGKEGDHEETDAGMNKSAHRM